MQSMSKLTVIGIVLLMIATVPTAYAITHSSEVTIAGNSFIYRIISSNPVTISDETPGYEPVNSTVTVNGTEYETIQIVNETNDKGGIADSTGHVNVKLTLNDDKPFCIAIHKDNGLLSSMTVTVTINGNTRQYSSDIILFSYTQYIGTSKLYTNLSELIEKNDTIQSDSEITIRITDNFGYVPDNVTASVLFV